MSVGRLDIWLEEVNYAGKKSIGYYPYSNTYNQGWKDHLNI